MQEQILGGIEPSSCDLFDIPHSDVNLLGTEKMFTFQKKRDLKSQLLLDDKNFWNYFKDSSIAKWASKKIPKQPYKVLDAPLLRDDYYLNLLDWGSNNVLAVGLDRVMYLWNSANWQVSSLVDLSKVEKTAGDYISSIAWSPNADLLSFGTCNGYLQIWDVKAQKLVRLFRHRNQRIGSISWWSHTLASGGKDHKVHLQDIREKNEYKKLEKHKQEVWGLKWSPNEDQLATGGNDNFLYIYNNKCLKHPYNTFVGHSAAVKALSWSAVKHGIIVSGGGSADGWIRFWNTNTDKLENVISTNSQIWNMAFSKSTNSLITTHGFTSSSSFEQNQIVVWNSQTFKKKAVLKGHTQRVIYLTLNREGDVAVTGSGDETLRFSGSRIIIIN